MHTKRAALIGVLVLSMIGGGAKALADLSEGASPPSVEPVGNANLVATSGAFDPTILTKFIVGRGFVASQGVGADADIVAFNGQTCVQPDATSGAAVTVLFAPVELPDGARIKQIVFYGEDTNAGNIQIDLFRSAVTVPGAGPPTRSETQITTFTTTGAAAGVVAVSSPDNLGEVTGIVGTAHRFHVVRVQMDNAALGGHVLCGVEVRYQVPVAAADAGTVYHPITPVRAYDSRIAAYAGAGVLTPNSSKIISIKDGHNSAGGVNAPDVVPFGATSITYNITIASPTGPNFVAVTPGDAGSFFASAVNFNGTADIANAATVNIDVSRQIKVWGGDQTGAAHIIIDITGYYAPPVPYPNMAN